VSPRTFLCQRRVPRLPASGRSSKERRTSRVPPLVRIAVASRGTLRVPIFLGIGYLFQTHLAASHLQYSHMMDGDTLSSACDGFLAHYRAMQILFLHCWIISQNFRLCDRKRCFDINATTLHRYRRRAPSYLHDHQSPQQLPAYYWLQGRLLANMGLYGCYIIEDCGCWSAYSSCMCPQADEGYCVCVCFTAIVGQTWYAVFYCFFS
jgi:hypothetical protein